MTALKTVAGVVFLLVSLLFAYYAFMGAGFAHSLGSWSAPGIATIAFFVGLYFIFAAFCSYRLLQSVHRLESQSVFQRIIVVGPALLLMFFMFAGGGTAAPEPGWLMVGLMYFSCAIVLALPLKNNS